MAISLKVVKENLTYVDDKKATHGNVDFGALNGDSIVGMYTLSHDIYAAMFPQLFDIYKYLRIQMMFIQIYRKIQRFCF